MDDKNPFGAFWGNGPSAGKFYHFPGSSAETSIKNSPTQHFMGPICTGSSIIGIKYDKGVIIAGDTLISLSGMARFHNIDRVFQVNKNIVIGISGDYADFQFLKQQIDEIIIADFSWDDKNELKPKNLYTWLTRVLYNRRSKLNPLWVDIVVGGMQNEEPFLGHINFRGRSHTNNVIATGVGTQMAMPLIREFTENKATDEAAAQELVKKSMQVLFYRDCRAYPRYSKANINHKGCVISKHDVEENWDMASRVMGY